MKKLLLRNRYGDKNYLVEVSENRYKLELSDEYMRLIFAENGKDYEAIDPSGGPFMQVGGSLRGYCVNEVDDLVITSFDLVKNVGIFVNVKMTQV